ncbi:hypothetical protein [Campylobacter geochelonis]|uniref:Periplasmic protein n=1 Tax=Campylobacter geochelonis TaxID=1780362 RepID=A0A128ELK8_9BACT|nr:hypothetical protein [Campylobacter geochelonis]QKF71489.1 hypothetical protein CGEO_1191 [Campylobacter geochelonis]CZE49332.1 Uncharacterised protein [Campylobacter geochelonis]
MKKASKILIFSALSIALIPLPAHQNLANTKEIKMANLTENKILNTSLKNFFKSLHGYYNFSYEKLENERKNCKKNVKDKVELNMCQAYYNQIYNMCRTEGKEWFERNYKNSYDDNNCEFWTINDKFDFEYLKQLNYKICKNSKFANKYNEDITLLEQNQDFKEQKLAYPWQWERVVDKNGIFIHKLYFDGLYDKKVFFGKNAFLMKSIEYNLYGDYMLVILFDEFVNLYNFIDDKYEFCRYYHNLEFSKEALNQKEKITIWIVPIDKRGNLIKTSNKTWYQISDKEDREFYFDKYINHLNKNKE